jgi:hypothetical protein
MSGFDNNSGTTQPSFVVGGPTGVSLQSDSLTAALNVLAANGILAPARVGWAIGPNDAVSLYQLRSILNPTTFAGDATACLIQPV